MWLLFSFMLSPYPLQNFLRILNDDEYNIFLLRSFLKTQYLLWCSENKSCEECLIKLWLYQSIWVCWDLLTQTIPQHCVNFRRGEEKQILEFFPFSHSLTSPLGKGEISSKGAGCEISRCSERRILVLHNEIWCVEMRFEGYFLSLNNTCCHQLFLIILWIMVLSRQWLWLQMLLHA